jgi:hypothetical protein
MRTRIAIALVSTLLATAPPADAQVSYQLCTGGGAQSCAWIEIMTTGAAGGTTDLVVRAQNLQGVAGFGTTGASVLDRIFLNFATPLLPTVSGTTDMPAGSPGVTSYDGIGDKLGQTPQPWSVFDANGMFTLVLLGDNADEDQFTDVLGCDAPSPFEDPGLQTCGAPGSEWVEFAFNVGAGFDTADLASVGFGIRYGQLPGQEHVCNDAPSANVTCRLAGASVVPEPGTVLLLGSGLGLLAVGAIRRRGAAT